MTSASLKSSEMSLVPEGAWRRYPGWEAGEFQAFAEFVRANGVRYRYLGYTPQWYSAAVILDAIADRT